MEDHTLIGNSNGKDVEQLREVGVTWSEIARICGISRNSLYKRRKQLGLEEPNVKLDDADLEILLKHLSLENPSWGSVTLKGALLTLGCRASEKRIRVLLREIDPENVLARKKRRLQRRKYSVPGSNYLWSLDGHHKMIFYHIVVHGCIDGYSRKLIFLEVNADNRASSVLDVFLEGVSRSGLPHRVRGDFGGENEAVADLMRHIYPDDNRFLFGPSVHNQRIERMWRDVREKVIGPYKEVFISLENDSLLNQLDVVDLFCLQYVFLPRIQRKLDLFTESWNNHSLRTARGKTPNQLWLVDMCRQYPGKNFYVPSIKEDRPMDAFIQRTINSTFMCDVPRSVLLLLVHEAINILPNPIIDDGTSGVTSYLVLRQHLHNL